jgi:hypothetical protein
MKADTLREELKKKIVSWLISFHHLDPRYKILTFFNQVASGGADNFVDEEEEEWEPKLSQREETVLTPLELMLKKAMNTSSILTVWRPTSNDAMRHMMERTGTGKGLDIKGKSAKKGKLSAFVPFLQIHEEEHKDQIQEIPRKAKMRVYYYGIETRNVVMEQLEPLGNDHMEFDADLIIPSEMIELNEYAASQNLYGIELSQRLFWLGCVTQQDITRDGTDTETGRPSMPGFQDANLKTLKLACHAKPLPPTPMPVVLQYDKNREHAMQPQCLLMAYEENGKVTPVVSDFDGFLMGWRREALWFGCHLPHDQEDLMLWCVDRIEQILDSKPSTDTWTVRWLEVLKQDASSKRLANLHIPQYGFGDPKSYGIMERAAEQMIETGAVRHGSECFNYYFPQEIDDYFLLISDTLEPVPWKYCNVQELQAILSERINKDGFVFPLNPKWILCDEGWKKLYDELMASDALYAEYTKDVWYPPASGVREKINRIHEKHPHGFQRQRRRTSFVASEHGYSPLRQHLTIGSLSGSAAFGLAELELDHYKLQNYKTSKMSKKSFLAEQIQASMKDLPYNDDDDDDCSDDACANGARKTKSLLQPSRTQKLARKTTLSEELAMLDEEEEEEEKEEEATKAKTEDKVTSSDGRQQMWRRQAANDTVTRLEI